jgi:uncharacterized protein (TIGR04255 family)
MREKLKTPPVYFTVAQIRHNPFPLERYEGEILDGMRKNGFPDCKKALVRVVTFAQPAAGANGPAVPEMQQISRIAYSNIDGTTGFVVEPSAVSFFTARYDVFDKFLDQFMSGVKIVHEAVKLDFYERVGLRYVDAVAAPAGGKLADYVDQSLLGVGNILPQQAQIESTLTETRFRTADCTVIARSITLTGRLGVPADLTLNYDKLEQRFQAIDGPHVILDIDASVEQRMSFQTDELKDLLIKLRAGVGIAFDSVIKPAAFAAWNA